MLIAAGTLIFWLSLAARRNARRAFLASQRRQHTVDSLRHAERFARKLSEASLTGLYVIDLPAQRLTFANKEYERLTGHTIVQLNSADGGILGFFHPEEQDKMADHLEQLRRAEDGQILDNEYRFKSSRGWIWCISRETVLNRDEDGNVRQYLGTVLDITEKKHSEERLRLAYARLWRLITPSFESRLEQIKKSLTDQTTRLSEIVDDLLKVSRREVREQESVGKPQETAQAAPNPLEIVIVDDNRDMASLVAALLEDLGHRVTLAFDGRSALQKALQQLPDAVLVDIRLPDMTGNEVIERLRQEGLVHSLIIAVTGFNQEQERSAAKRAGADQFLTEPLDVDLLNRVLRSWSRTRRAEAVRFQRQERAESGRRWH